MSTGARPKRIVIMGAAGRDFHNFNVAFRQDPAYEVVAFTAAQIPGISGRRYPASLCGPGYPHGIPILEEENLQTICTEQKVEEVVFAYSDVEHAFVMHKASIALAAGADFTLLGPERTMLRSRIPVIAICAVRTGAGKSQTARWLSRRLRQKGLAVAVIRHPMPYGDIERQAVQRFATVHDLDQAACTIEEREEYEPHIAAGGVVFAGVDYASILQKAEQEADVIVWDGGNNDFSFLRPDLHIVLVDPLRPGDEKRYHPGEAVLRMADIVVVAKTNSASGAAVQEVSERARNIAPNATVVRAASMVTLEHEDTVAGKRVIVVDDGPTITHGGMPYGAGYVAAIQAGVKEIVDPRASAVGDIAGVFQRYAHIGKVLPAMGYSRKQLAELQATINGSDAEAVISGTPSDLSHLMDLNKPVIQARYELAEVGEPKLSEVIEKFLRDRSIVRDAAIT
jgi:predicted GTPase